MSDFEELARFDPDDPADPHGDRATLKQLEARGSDLSQATHFIHYLVFPNERAARDAAQDIAEGLGYGTTGSVPESQEDDWMIRAEREQIPTLENIDRMRRALTLAAEKHGGEYDGWEAQLRD